MTCEWTVDVLANQEKGGETKGSRWDGALPVRKLADRLAFVMHNSLGVFLVGIQSHQ